METFTPSLDWGDELIGSALWVAKAWVFAAIGVGGYLNDIADGWLFCGWIVLGVGYHIIFGSGLVIPRREAARPEDGTVTGKYWTLWKQR